MREIAFNAHMSSSHLSDIELGKKEVSTVVLNSICKALDVPMYRVLEDSAKELKKELTNA